MKVRGIDHLQLEVSDPAASSRFYADHLGLEVFFLDLPRRVFLLAGEDLLTLVRGRPARAGDTFHLGFSARDAEELRAWRDRLVSRGVTVVNEQYVPEGASVYVRDPDGYLIELYFLTDGTRTSDQNTNGRTTCG